MKTRTLFRLTVDVVLQLLILQGGIAVVSDGSAYRVAPDVAFVDAINGRPAAAPSPGSVVRLHFGDDGTVHAIDVGLRPGTTPAPHGPAAVAVVPAASGTPDPRHADVALVGKPVAVRFVVSVPATTGPSDTVYLTTAEQLWNPIAIRLDRIDALHFAALVNVPAGVDFLYLYTRGNGQTIEQGSNGLQRVPRSLHLSDLAPRTIDDTIVRWGDEAGNTLLPQPHTSPSPFNPAPYPNVPGRPPW